MITNLVMVIFLVSLNTTFALPSDFMFYKNVFINATTWKVNVTLDTLPLQQSKRNFENLCQSSEGKFDNFAENIDKVKLATTEERYIPVEKLASFLIQQKTCRAFGPTCDIAQIKDETEMNKVKEAIQHTQISTFFLGYETSENHFVSNFHDKRSRVEEGDYLSGQDISVNFCERPYILWPQDHSGSCIFLLKNSTQGPFSYSQAKISCENYFNGKLWNPSAQLDSKIKAFYEKKYADTEYFVEGIFHKSGTNTDIKPCNNIPHSGTALRAKYNFGKHCLNYVDSKTATGGAFCYKNGHFKTTINSRDFWQYTRNSFDRKPGAVHYNVRTKSFSLEDRNFPHASVCKCSTDKHAVLLEQHYKKGMHSLNDASRNWVKDMCTTIDSIDSDSPYNVVMTEGTEEGTETFEYRNKRDVFMPDRLSDIATNIIIS